MKKFILLLVVLTQVSLGAEPLKAVFDCAVGDLDWISLRLSLIKKTAQQISEKGKEYEFVITIHSYCTPIINGELKSLPEDKRKKIELIQSQLKTLKEFYGVRIKACAIAMERFKIKRVPKFIEVVPR